MLTHIHNDPEQEMEDFPAFHRFASREVKRYKTRHHLDSAQVSLLVPRWLLKSFTATVEHEIRKLARELGVRLTWVPGRPGYLFRLEGSTEAIEAHW